MGSVITFYSFKGGVGRTMALANIAVLLANRGLRVLAVDADLEAPGLNRYFQPHGLHPVEEQPGLLELLAEAPTERPHWERYASILQINGGLPLTVLTSGRRDATYARRVLEFDWEHFFRERQGGGFFERLREQWKQAFDIVLIDSRTGITDSGGVFTIQMPDILVLVASPNHQSISGVREVAESAQTARQKLPYDRMPLSVLPILSRLDTRAEYEQSREWQETFAREMEGFYADWLPRPFTSQQIVEKTKLPYVAYFGFGEKLPVVTEGTSDPEGLGFAYESLAALVAKDLADAGQIIERRDTYVRAGALDLNEIKALRFNLLYRLFERDKGGQGSRFLLSDLALEAGIPQDLTGQIGLYLKNEGLISYRSLARNPPVSITHQGIKEVENALSEPERATNYFPPVNIVNVGHMIGSTIQQASINSSQSVSLPQEHAISLEKLAEEIRENINGMGLAQQDKHDLIAEIRTIEAQLAASKPKLSVVKECLHSAKSILERAAGSILASQIGGHIGSLLSVLS